MLAILTLFIIIMLSLLVMRIATMALMLTGLSQESARFQARSAYTGVGFTTTESESISAHPVRRQIIMLLMLVGNIGIATVMATVLISYIKTSQAENWWINVITLILCLALLILFAKSQWVERRLNKIIAWGLRRWTKLELKDYLAVLHLKDGFAVSEMKVEQGDWILDKTLSDAALAQEGVLILGIVRKDGSYIGTPYADTKILPDDVLILYGHIDRLEDLDQRRKGKKGEKAHKKAVSEHLDEIKEMETVISDIGK